MRRPARTTARCSIRRSTWRRTCASGPTVPNSTCSPRRRKRCSSITKTRWCSRFAMAPLARLRSQILARSPNDLRPLDERHAPIEIAPAIEALNHLLSELRDSNAVQQRFLANAAHQLRTPLAALQMHLELLFARALP